MVLFCDLEVSIPLSSIPHWFLLRQEGEGDGPFFLSPLLIQLLLWQVINYECTESHMTQKLVGLSDILIEFCHVHISF